MTSKIPHDFDTKIATVENVCYSVAKNSAAVDNTNATTVPAKYETIEFTNNSKKKGPPKTKKCGRVVICLIVALIAAISLFIATTAALIFSRVQISGLHSEVALLQSTLLTVETDLEATQSINSTRDQGDAVIDILNKTGYIFSSCAAILQSYSSAPSGYYRIKPSNGSAIDAYCNMTMTCGGITGGWMRVAELNMTDNTAQCPSSLELVTSPRRTCRQIDSGSETCSSDTFSVGGVGYSKVCGRIRAYQVGSPNAFNNLNIETFYVDGVSLTHGQSPRQHIWTFVGAVNEDDQTPGAKCPCINTAISSSVTHIPAFVGEDYFCDTGALTGNAPNIFYDEDPLWDGAGCGPQNTCCSFNSPPWFYKQLPQPTTDGIVMRVCRDQGRDDEDIAIELVEIYVQ